MSRKIVYTRHASDMLVLRRIKKSLVEKCINEPDKVVFGKKGRKIYLRNFGKNDLKVVGIENEEIMVITCHWIARERIK